MRTVNRRFSGGPMLTREKRRFCFKYMETAKSGPTQRVRIGVDIGGTFTDIVAVDGPSGAYRILKVPSTPSDYCCAIRNGLERLFAEEAWDPDAVELFFHGTTVATNTVIEKKGARIGLLTTAGFRDVLEVGRTNRLPVDLYNLDMDRAPPLVPRRLRIGVPERVNHRGEVETPLCEEATGEAIERLLAMRINALAICFLNAYANSVHELRARDIARSLAPGLYTAISSEINPQYKEFERTSTTVLSAYVGPRVSRYITGVQEILTNLGVRAPLHVMQASGGAMTADAVRDRAIRTILSGPAAGVLGALKVGEALGERDFVSLDMGGTSADVSLVKDGSYRVVEETGETGYSLRIPMMDIVTIGAGGGSIARIDTGGVLKVGPDSAGAEPGPACYGTGEEATITDAHVVLGYIDPDHFLGGEMKLDAERARDVVERKVAVPLRIGVEAAASGIVRVANANMLRAIRRVSIERGHDARDFSLIPFGGAGGLHAGQLLSETHMRQAIIPIYPGVLSACGLVEADLEYQHIQSILRRLDEVDAETLLGYFTELETRGADDMQTAGVPVDTVRFVRAANLRYRKQMRQVAVEFGGEDADHNWIRNRFCEEHERLYGYATDEPIEVVDLRVACIQPLSDGLVWKTEFPDRAHQVANRVAYFDELGACVECPVYARATLKSGEQYAGPALIEQEETNIVVCPRQVFTVHASGNIVITPVTIAE